MSLHILRPGPLSLIQDWGRHGCQHWGMSPGGPLDEQAFLWANKLLENPAHAAMLEITLGPFSLRAGKACQIALTGAEMQAQRNGEPLENWSSHYLHAGDQLELRLASSGLRGYLAVAGGLQVPGKHGSCATVVREKLGGLNGLGRPLQANDELPIKTLPQQQRRSVPPAYQPDYQQTLSLRLIPAYQWHAFDVAQRNCLLKSEFEVSTEADRMGYRLSGPPVAPPAGGLISEGIAYGAVQIPPDGQPIVLLRDRQTIGGYPKLGCIASADAAQLAQRRPGQAVRFTIGDLDRVSAETQTHQQFFGL